MMVSRPDLVAVTRLIPLSKRRCWEAKGWDNFVASASALTGEGSRASANRMRSPGVERLEQLCHPDKGPVIGIYTEI